MQELTVALVTIGGLVLVLRLVVDLVRPRVEASASTASETGSRPIAAIGR